jgi:hypothetical protein
VGSLVKAITAVVLSQQPYESKYDAVTTLNHVEPTPFRNHYDINRARRLALQKVTTPYWFFLDSDDSLPDDYESVLQECLNRNKAVVYTQELRKLADGTEHVNQPGEFDQDRFVRNVMMMHHLVLCNTVYTREALTVIPNERQMMEPCLYFQLAKISVAHVPRIGYVWNRGNGMHTKSDALEFQARAAIWCSRNRE